MTEGRRKTLALAAGAMALACPLAAHAQEEGPPVATTMKVSTGVNYSEGHYGRRARTRVLSAPITVRVARGRFSLRISVPFVSIDGPGTLLDGARSSTSGSSGTASSGDVSGSDDGASGGGDAVSDDDDAIDDNGGGSGSDDGGSDDGGSDDGGSDDGGTDDGGSDDGGTDGGGTDDGGSDDGGCDSDESGNDSGSGSDDDDAGAGCDGSGSSGEDPGGPPRIEPTYVAPPLAAAPASVGTGRRSGLGDVTVTLGYAADPLPWLTLQASGRVKLPTASRSRGIGTGKVDATLAAEAIARFGRASVHAGARRRFLGRPEGWNIRDGWGVGAGASYALGNGVSVGADYDWLQSATRGRAPLSEATGWISLPLNQRLRLQAYAGTGFSSRSSALLAGLSVSLRM